MTATTIPKTTAGLKSTLDGLVEQENVILWKRSAIVYAFTEPGAGVGDLASGTLTLPEFAAIGIRGLKDRGTVSSYRDVWVQAMKAGVAKHISPGDKLAVPDAKFDDFWQNTAAAKYQVTARERRKREGKTSEEHKGKIEPQSRRAKSMQAIDSLQASRRFADSAAKSLEGVQLDEEMRRELFRTVQLIQQALLRVSESLNAESVAA